MKPFLPIFFSLFITFCSSSPFNFLNKIDPNTLVQSASLKKKYDDPSLANLRSIFNGYWEQGGLDDPQTLINCFDPQYAQIALKFIQVMALDLYITNWIGIYKGTEYYLSLFPQNMKDCINNNTDVVEMEKAYNTTGMTLKQIEEKIVLYLRRDYSTYVQLIDMIYESSQTEDFEAVGQNFGRLVQHTFNQSIDVLV